MRAWLQRWLGINVLAATVTALHDRVTRLEADRGIGPGEVRDMQRRLDAVVEVMGGYPEVRHSIANLESRLRSVGVAVSELEREREED